MMEEMALQYFRGLTEAERKALIKRFVKEMTEEEKLLVAQLLVGKQKK